MNFLINDVINFLTIVDKPFSEIETAAVLRSPMFSITDQTLYELCAERTKKNTSLLNLILKNDFSFITVKHAVFQLNRFIKLYNCLFSNKTHLTLSEMVELIFKETFFEAIQLGKYHGRQRYLHLRKFINILAKFEQNHGPDLSLLVRYLAKIRTADLRVSDTEARLPEHIQVMSIHKAKGLEFKIVFVCDLAHQERATRGKTFFNFERTIGLGLDLPAEKELRLGSEKQYLYMCKTIREKDREENIKELKRIMYVAATRTKEKLFFTASLTKPPSEKRKSYLEQANMFSWLMAVYPELNELFADQNTVETASKNEYINFYRYKYDQTPIKAFREKHQLEKEYEKRKQENKQIQVTGHSLELLSADTGIRSMSAILQTTDAVINATEYSLLNFCSRAYFLHSIVPEDLVELSGEGRVKSSAKIGNLVHRAIASDDPIKQVENARRVLLPEELKVFERCLNNYRRFPVGARHASPLPEIREQNFIVRHKDIFFQGIIDFAYLDAGRGEACLAPTWVVVDYKTSPIDNEKHKQFLIDLYKGQLQVYAYALEQITGKPVKKAQLFFLYDNIIHDFSKTELNLELKSPVIAEKCQQCFYRKFCIK